MVRIDFKDKESKKRAFQASMIFLFLIFSFIFFSSDDMFAGQSNCVCGEITINGQSFFHNNITLDNQTSDFVYLNWNTGGYIYDNGTALILGHD